MITINKNAMKKQVKFMLRKWSIAYMDAQAVLNGYDDLNDIRLVDDESPEEKAAKQAGNAFRKAVRTDIKQIRKDVEDDLRTMPTEAELWAELPVLVLP
ncbi:MAG: hypothetical protein DRI24_19455 [Deltaproteobacteria bacterium]|nr:MAG: hypothetical protein DRI24_19455 [Deltaproteobacteria bacterium]